MPPRSADLRIADQMVEVLNSAELSLPLTAERLYVNDWDTRKELDTLQCGVWPAESTAEAWQRDQLQKTHRIGITFAQKVSAAPIAELDALCDLVDEVTELFELTIADLDDGRSFVNQAWDYILRFDPARLDRNKGVDGTVKYTGMFASMIAFEFVSME